MSQRIQRWIVLAVGLQGFELIALTLAGVALAISSLFVAAHLEGVASRHPACFGLTAVGGSDCIGAQAEFAPWEQIGENLLWIGWAAPVLVGVMWGAPIVAREIEQHTAPITWSLAVSRSRWLAGRAMPIAVATVLLLGLLGFSSELLTQARMAGDDPGFLRYDQRGVLLPLRAALAFTVALTVGAILGRTLPSLMVATAITASILVMLNLGLDQWRRVGAEVVPVGAAPGSSVDHGLVLAPVAIMPDGSVVPENRTDGLPDNSFTDAVLVLPASEYWLWVGREAALIMTLTALAAIIGPAVVGRRNPL